VFGSKSLDRFRSLYERYRNKLAVKLNNERLKHVQLRSFRHWKGTQLYSETKDIMYVKWFLGHKRIENTMVYVHLTNFESNQYITKVAKTLSECEELVKLGYEYVTDVEGFKLFRKRK
jgi:site-specific recombinase XerC